MHWCDPGHSAPTANLSDVDGCSPTILPAKRDYAIGGRKKCAANRRSRASSGERESRASRMESPISGEESAGKARAAPQAPVAPIGMVGQCGAPEWLPSPCTELPARDIPVPAMHVVPGSAASRDDTAPVSASISAAHDAHTPPTVESERATSAKSAARKRNRSFMSANLIAHRSEGNPFGAPKVCKALHPRGLGRFYA